MRSEPSRIETLQASVRGIFKIATTLSSDTYVSLVPFEGHAAPGLKTEQEMEEALSRIRYSTGGTVPKPLKNRILSPLLQAAQQKQLRPTIVAVITDGDVSRFSVPSIFVKVIKSLLLGA